MPNPRIEVRKGRKPPGKARGKKKKVYIIIIVSMWKQGGKCLSPLFHTSTSTPQPCNTFRVSLTPLGKEWGLLRCCGSAGLFRLGINPAFL